MKAIITHGHRFSLGKDGKVYTENDQTSGFSFFRRYLDVFDSITVVGRLKQGPESTFSPVTGPGVYFAPIPYYLGPWQYLKIANVIKREVDSIFNHEKKQSAFIFRCPEKISSLFIDKLSSNRHPYGMEIISDPYDVFQKGSIQHPLRPILHHVMPKKLKDQCMNASAVSYVTEKSIQKNYPAPIDIFTTHYSSIQLHEKDYVVSSRRYNRKKQTYNIIFVGNLSQLYKGQDVLVEATTLLIRQGLDICLTIVGEGKHRHALERKSLCLGGEGRVNFIGALPSGDSVREQLDKSDLFVLPSRGEGLPRAMIEAMARGLPCIGSNASGIPELLSTHDMVPPGSVEALASKIREVLSDPDRMECMSARNLLKAREYDNSVLQKRRIEFYKHLKNVTEHHLWKRYL